MAEHTPGPFRVAHRPNGTLAIVGTGVRGGETLAIVDSRLSPEEDGANAALLAAAPDLLAFCRRVESELSAELARLELQGFFHDSMAVRHWTALREAARDFIFLATDETTS